MKGLSLCQKVGSLLLLLVLCVVIVGCGGGGVDALVKEHKELTAEMMKATDPEKLKTLKTKMDELNKKVKALSEAQQLEYAKKLLEGK
jgi:hypothetical protein